MRLGDKKTMEALSALSARLQQQAAAAKIARNAELRGEPLPQYTERMNKLLDFLQRYDVIKSRPLTHQSSWVSRGLQASDNQGCNPIDGCVSTCPFFRDWHKAQPQDNPEDFVQAVLAYDKEQEEQKEEKEEEQQE